MDRLKYLMGRGTWDMGRVGQREWSISLDEGKLPDWVKLRIKHNAALNGYGPSRVDGKAVKQNDEADRI